MVHQKGSGPIQKVVLPHAQVFWDRLQIHPKHGQDKAAPEDE